MIMKFLSFILFMTVGLVISFTPVLEAQLSEDELYKVGVGDVINITVMGHKDLSLLVTVAGDGTIAFPHLGTVYVKDKTLQKIEKEITKELGAGYIKLPIVSVSLISSVSKRIFIHGEVTRIGAMPFEKDISIIKALSLAGGISDNGLHGKLKVRRKQEGKSSYKVVVESDLDNGSIMNSEVEDFLLIPDDILIVERSDTFFIQGEIATKSGAQVLERGMTVSRALALVGGIAENGLYGNVKLRRKREGSTGYFDVKEADLDNGVLVDSEMEDMLIQPDDILKVERSESFFIEGEVAVPARYVLEFGMTVGRAITVAGGITEGGLYGKVKVRRKRESEAGYKDIEIDIEGVIEGSETENMILQPDDILIVERSKTYIVYGEVNRIGEYPLKDDTTVLKAILEAGGFNKWGSESRVKVLRPKDDGKGFETIKVDIEDVLDGDLTADISLSPGDIVIVSSGLF
jgi:polysaccharide export outer membrane protein